ncbi:unnamed protein product [Paramecium octaurelia]|uniref:Uncharacterized protein n=1 Tax=Paramecium octaurelia TaxID=43137 RepID=A0A8S1VNQ2_PAROT|nr:unnamed protein product [Paramecium octaurelia]
MSERSLSPTDYYELKHVKSIKVNQNSIKKRRSIYQKSNLQLQLESNRCNLSCECSNCGKPNGFQLKIHVELPLKETRYQKKQRILKKFKAVGNAIIFILIYKLEAIKNWKKKMHNLKLSKNLTILRRPAVFLINNQPSTFYLLKDRNIILTHQFPSKNSLELSKGHHTEFSHTIYTQQTSSNPRELRPFDPSPARPKSRPQIDNSGKIKNGNEYFSEVQQLQTSKESQTKLKRLVRSKAIQKTVEMCSCKSQNTLQNSQDEEVLMNESVHRFQQSNQKVSRRRSSIQLYLDKIFKNTESVKKENNLKPLNIFNEEINKSKSKYHLRSTSQFYLTNSQSQLVPYYEQIRTTTNSSYYNNKKNGIKTMTLVKNKSKAIKIKK